MIRIIGYGVIAEKPRVRKLGHFFRAPCSKNYALDQKWITRFNPGCRCENVVFVTGTWPWQRAGIKFIQCVSGQKSAFSPLQEKLCVESKNDSHLLELSLRSLSACTVWGRSNYARRLYERKLLFFCMSRLVCLPVRDIVQTSIV